jgi:hypothetical protein
MPFIYHLPQDVLSPRALISSVTVLYDGGVNIDHPYSIAKLVYGGNECIAMRWNISEYEWDNEEKEKGNIRCLGLPSSRGYPTWFIIPTGFLLDILSGNSEVSNIINSELQQINRDNDGI